MVSDEKIKIWKGKNGLWNIKSLGFDAFNQEPEDMGWNVDFVINGTNGITLNDIKEKAREEVINIVWDKVMELEEFNIGDLVLLCSELGLEDLAESRIKREFKSLEKLKSGQSSPPKRS